MPELPRLLILFAHPALEKSRANRALLAALDGLPQVTLHDLYEEYPNLDIKVAREQALLREHDIVVFQHPFYWYSAPSLVKEWQDLVLTYGFAYGPKGTALAGKWCTNAITAGGPANAYQEDGYNHFTVRQLLAPFEQTARLCGMKYLDPFVLHDALDLSAEKLHEAGKLYAGWLQGLQHAFTQTSSLQTS
jgi:glutathione-regulated potassium-efflux system ancillary protein KefG